MYSQLALLNPNLVSALLNTNQNKNSIEQLINLQTNLQQLQANALLMNSNIVQQSHQNLLLNSFNSTNGLNQQAPVGLPNQFQSSFIDNYKSILLKQQQNKINLLGSDKTPPQGIGTVPNGVGDLMFNQNTHSIKPTMAFFPNHYKISCNHNRWNIRMNDGAMKKDL